MRIALCISGIPRCYNYHPESLLNLFAPHTVEVFMHTWADVTTLEQRSEIIQLWQPRVVVFEPTPTELFRDWAQKTHHIRSAGRAHANTFPMWYSVYQANELKRGFERAQGWKFDAVCRARTDLWAGSTWTHALDLIKPHQVLIPSERNYDDGYNDTIALGDSASMDKYSAVWTWFPTALEKSCRIGYEKMLRDYLDNWTDLAVVKTSVNVRLMRPQDLGQPYDKIDTHANPPPKDNNDLVRSLDGADG